jgi:tetratricopeptide (TPR) repeat protein
MTIGRTSTWAVGAVLLACSALLSQPTSKDKKSSNSNDIPMVERLLAARREYEESLQALRGHYIAVGDYERARWAEDELMQLHRISKQAFRLELEVPPQSLQAANNIPEANDLFRQAISYKSSNRFGQNYVDDQRRAEKLFQQILTKYPQSDKISDVAYQLGDTYEGKSYNQPARAAMYYERCFQWNPKTQLDARLRAAKLYEKPLNERARAIEIYREIITHEIDPKRVEEAQRRLGELGGMK